jgi:hypothetical protein
LNLRDNRTIEEQVWSGFRLGGSIVLTIVVVLMLLLSSILALGNPSRYGYAPLISWPNPMVNRIVGSCGLVLLSVLTFLTARLWVKVLIGFAARVVLAGTIAVLFLSQAAIKTPRLVLAEQVGLAAAILILCFRYVDRDPTTIEAMGLTGVIVSLSFGVAARAFLPPLIGLAWLGLAEIIAWKLRESLEVPSPQRLEQGAK